MFDKIGYSERKGPGVTGFLAVRERHIDEFLQQNLAEGVQQVIILGAGLDARLSLRGLRTIRVFEVDHPLHRPARSKRCGGAPAHVTYVAVDFNTQTLAKRLPECGYERAGPFIWQGVTQYLTERLTRSWRLSPAVQPGSAVIFDYMYPTLLDGMVKRGEVANMRSRRWASGEALVFGIPEGTVTEFLELRGFTDVQDADHEFLRATYLTGPNAARTIAYGYAIASAVVKAH